MSVAALLLAGGLSQAAPATPDAVGFGLEKLTWGMTMQEARRRYPALTGEDAEPGQIRAVLTWTDYAQGPCRFAVMATFSRGRLTQVEFNTSEPRLKPCNAYIKKTLQDRYGSLGGGIGSNHNGFTEYGSWGGEGMDITYGALDGAFTLVTFRRVER